MKRLSPVWLLVLTPLLWLAPMLVDPAGLPMHPGSQFTDLAVTHWPNAIYLHEAVFRLGEIPLWNPYILGGVPFAADPLSGLHYPPLWLAAAFPEAWAFNALFYLHLAWAGAGAYLLAREEGVPRFGALCAGLLFGGMSKFAAHIAAGHLTLVCAAAWTPWLVRAAGRLAGRGGLHAAAAAGLTAGILTLADPRWAIPAFCAAGAYALWRLRTIEPVSRPSALRAFAGFTAAGAIAAGISAPLMLPLLEFLPLTTRAAMGAQDAATLSLPPANLLGLAFPAAGGSLEWICYFGAATLLLAAAAVAVRRRKGRSFSMYWTAAFLLTVLLSLGGYLPGYADLAAALPGVGLLRVPPRMLFLGGLALAMLAGRGACVAMPAAGEIVPPFGRSRLERIGRIAGGILAIGAVLAVSSVALRHTQPVLQAALVWCGAGLAVAAHAAGKLRTGWARAALVAVLAADLFAMDARLIVPHPAADFAASTATIRIQKAAAEAGDSINAYRAFSPSYSLPQPAAVLAGVRMLDGVNPLLLQSTQTLVLRAARIPAAGYSVTLPPFATGNPSEDNRSATPNFSLMSLLNVKYLASAFPLNSAMLLFDGEADGVLLYRTFFPSPRAWVAESADGWTIPVPARPARITRESPNRLMVEAEGPGVLVVSEAVYPGWRASVDGRPAAIESAGAEYVEGGWWRMVRLEAGQNVVEMRYEPASWWAGLALCAAALAACGWGVRWGR